MRCKILNFIFCFCLRSLGFLFCFWSVTLTALWHSECSHTRWFLWNRVSLTCYAVVSVGSLSYIGGGDSSVVRAPDSWLKSRGFESLQGRRQNFLFQGRLSVLTLISVSVPPRVTAVVGKKSRSFRQKCGWHVTAKHAYTLRMWLCMKRHGS